MDRRSDSSADRTSRSGLSPAIVTPWTPLSTPVQQQQQNKRQNTAHSLPLVPFVGDKLEWVAEYSKPRHAFVWTVIHKLMAQSVPTFATQNLEGSEALHVPGDAVLSDGLGEGRPGWRVWELRAAGEQRVTALGTHVHPWFEVVFVDFAAKKPTERHICYVLLCYIRQSGDIEAERCL